MNGLTASGMREYLFVWMVSTLVASASANAAFANPLAAAQPSPTNLPAGDKAMGCGACLVVHTWLRFVGGRPNTYVHVHVHVHVHVYLHQSIPSGSSCPSVPLCLLLYSSSRPRPCGLK